MVDADAALGHHLLQVAQAQAVGQIPANTQLDHRSVDMTALEHLKSPRQWLEGDALTAVTEEPATQPNPTATVGRCQTLLGILPLSAAGSPRGHRRVCP